MIRFVQHIPNFVETDKPANRVEVETQAELLAHPAIASWTSDLRPGEPFYRWSLSMGRVHPHLMAEYQGGRHWWVVGTITDGLDALDLPVWESIYVAEIDGQEVEIRRSSPNPVSSSCGGWLWLRDGQIVKDLGYPDKLRTAKPTH